MKKVCQLLKCASNFWDQIFVTIITLHQFLNNFFYPLTDTCLGAPGTRTRTAAGGSNLAQGDT